MEIDRIDHMVFTMRDIAAMDAPSQKSRKADSMGLYH